MSYAVEKKVARDPSRFGHGAIEGVNNASNQTAFIPTLTLGIPGTVTMALMEAPAVLDECITLGRRIKAFARVVQYDPARRSALVFKLLDYSAQWNSSTRVLYGAM